MKDPDFADHLYILANKPVKAESQLHCLEQAVRNDGLDADQKSVRVL